MKLNIGDLVRVINSTKAGYNTELMVGKIYAVDDVSEGIESYWLKAEEINVCGWFRPNDIELVYAS